jgi:hypothetical protein
MTITTKPIERRFPLGRIYVSRGAWHDLPTEEIIGMLSRHAAGDWGILSREDWERNEEALANGSRLFSSYQSDTGAKVWVITEADRLATTLLLPSEY